MKSLLVLILFLIPACSLTVIDSANNKESIQNVKKRPAVDKSILPITYQIEGFSSCPLNSESLQTIVDIHNGVLKPKSEEAKKINNLPMSNKEMGQWYKLFGDLESAYIPSVLTEFDHKDVYFFIFDGTWNDKDSDMPKTIPAKLYDQLNELETRNPRVNTYYYPGVGTRTNIVKKIIDGTTGNGAVDKANNALDQLKKIVNSSGDAPHIYAIGFSRGAATARHFINLVDEYYNNEKIIGAPSLTLFSEPRIYAMLFDTVATGQLDKLNLDIPMSVTSVVHLVATSEQRIYFPVVRVNKSENERTGVNKIYEFDLPGVHSDIGGGYGDALEELSYLFASKWLEKQGLYINVHDSGVQELLNMGKNDSRWLKIGKPDDSGTRESLELEHQKDKNEGLVDIAKSKDDIVKNFNELITGLSLEVIAAKQELKKLEQEHASGKIEKFKGLALNTYLNGNQLIVRTNCPDDVSVNMEEGSIDVLKYPFIYLTSQYINNMRMSYGLINFYSSHDRNDFTEVDVDQ